MLAGFDWWLLILGIVGGAGLTWVLLADFRRHDDDLAADEIDREAEWIADESDAPLDARAVAEILRLHRAYLATAAPSLEDLDDAAWSEREARREADRETAARAAASAGSTTERRTDDLEADR